MPLFEAAIAGSMGGQFRIRVQVDLLGQEPGNNRSLVRYSAWIERVISGARVWNFDPTPGTIQRHDFIQNRNINGYDSYTAGQRWYLALNEDHWVGHDGNGNASPYYAAVWDGQSFDSRGQYLRNGAVSGNFNLPTINRFTNITQFYVTNITDVGFRIETAVSDMANFLQYSLEDGVGWRDQFGGNFFSYGFNVGGNFPSDKPYNLRVRVRRADSGLWSESGVIGTRTLVQGRFMDGSGV